uniref:Uncharacterized protein n=1 Tax=uncultured Prochlorococcus marinus clone ASNC1092 TaxID=379363 RepID=Q1PLD5_PROMR|nr:hypothetical protein ASNC1092_0024 [uncultured Prochlorococcus marinus clone ASNC1092]
MKRILLPLLAAFALPNAINANEKVLSEMSDIEANKILLGQVLSVCYAVDRNHITMKQKIDMLGFALNLHERAHGNKKTLEEDQMNAVGKVLDIFPDCFPEVKKDK